MGASYKADFIKKKAADYKIVSGLIEKQ